MSIPTTGTTSAHRRGCAALGASSRRCPRCSRGSTGSFRTAHRRSAGLAASRSLRGDEAPSSAFRRSPSVRVGLWRRRTSSAPLCLAGRANRRSGSCRVARRRRGRASVRAARCRSSARCGSVTTSRGSLRAARAWRTSSSKWNTSGPPISTVPLSGAPAATLATAAATSSAAIGWNSTCGRRTSPSTVALVGDALHELEELCRVHDRVRDR